MKLLKAYTIGKDGGYPGLVLEFAKNPPVLVDMFHKRSIADAGVVMFSSMDPDQPLEGFETITLEVYPGDPDSRLEIPATSEDAGTRDPLAVKLAREFLAAVDTLTFRPGVQVYPAEQKV